MVVLTGAHVVFVSQPTSQQHSAGLAIFDVSPPRAPAYVVSRETPVLTGLWAEERPVDLPTMPAVAPVFVESLIPHANSLARQKCYAREDRYDWRSYALAAGFPESVLPELEYVVSKESGGDLCAVNVSSGATCWIQQFPGGDAFLDPSTCMAQGYAKWVAGGHDFWQHWFQWWTGP